MNMINRLLLFSSMVVVTLANHRADAAILLNGDNRLARTETLARYKEPGLFGNVVTDSNNTVELAQFAVGAYNPYSTTLTDSSSVMDPINAMASSSATASQNSTISNVSGITVFDADGIASGASSSNIPGLDWTGEGTHVAQTNFGIAFTLTNPANFTLNGSIESIRSTSVSTTSALIRLWDGLNTDFSFEVADPSPGILAQQTIINNFTGTLPAGQYSFEAIAVNMSTSVNHTTSASAEFDFVFEMVEIPEPSSVMIVSLGLAGMFLVRQSRNWLPVKK